MKRYSELTVSEKLDLTEDQFMDAVFCEADARSIKSTLRKMAINLKKPKRLEDIVLNPHAHLSDFDLLCIECCSEFGALLRWKRDFEFIRIKLESRLAKIKEHNETQQRRKELRNPAVNSENDDSKKYYEFRIASEYVVEALQEGKKKLLLEQLKAKEDK